MLYRARNRQSQTVLHQQTATESAPTTSKLLKELLFLLAEWLQVLLLVFRAAPVCKVGTIKRVANGWSPRWSNLFAIKRTKVESAKPSMIANVQISARQAPEPVFGIHYQYLLNEIPRIWTRVATLRKCPLSLHDFLEQSHLVNLSIVKWSLAS